MPDDTEVSPPDLDELSEQLEAAGVEPEALDDDMDAEDYRDEIEAMADDDEPMTVDEMVRFTTETWANVEFDRRADHVDVEEWEAWGAEISMRTMPLLHVVAGDPDEAEFGDRADALAGLTDDVETAAMKHARRANQRESPDGEDREAFMDEVEDLLDDVPEVDVPAHEAFATFIERGHEQVAEDFEAAVEADERDQGRTQDR